MKNFTKITLALIVGVMAIGFSAFTNANVNTLHKQSVLKAGINVTGFLVQDQGAGEFSQSSAYSSDNCRTSETLLCGYAITSAGETNIPVQSTYSSTDISNYLMHHWIMAASGATAALYND